MALAESPILRPSDWLEWVDRPQTPAEERAVQRCVKENRPDGDQPWMAMLKRKLGWRDPLLRGRPKKRRK